MEQMSDTKCDLTGHFILLFVGCYWIPADQLDCVCRSSKNTHNASQNEGTSPSKYTQTWTLKVMSGVAKLHLVVIYIIYIFHIHPWNSVTIFLVWSSGFSITGVTAGAERWCRWAGNLRGVAGVEELGELWPHSLPPPLSLLHCCCVSLFTSTNFN